MKKIKFKIYTNGIKRMKQKVAHTKQKRNKLRQKKRQYTFHDYNTIIFAYAIFSVSYDYLSVVRLSEESPITKEIASELVAIRRELSRSHREHRAYRIDWTKRDDPITWRAAAGR